MFISHKSLHQTILQIVAYRWEGSKGGKVTFLKYERSFKTVTPAIPPCILSCAHQCLLPAENVFSHTPRIFHVDVISRHFSWIRLSNLVGSPHPEPVLVQWGQVFNLDLTLIACGTLGNLSPGSIACGGVKSLGK